MCSRAVKEWLPLIDMFDTDSYVKPLNPLPICFYNVQNVLYATVGEITVVCEVRFCPHQGRSTPAHHLAGPFDCPPEPVIKVRNVSPNRSRAKQKGAPVAAYARCGQCCLERPVLIEDVGVYVENVPENVEAKAVNRGSYWRCRHCYYQSDCRAECL